MLVTKPTKVVATVDPAVDLLAMASTYTNPNENDFARYLRDREFSLVKLHPGMKAAVFHIRRIPTSVYNTYVGEAISERQLYHRAFQMGVTQVDSLVDNDDVTHASLVPTGSRQTPAGEIKIWTDREMELFNHLFIIEVGHVANELSCLLKGNELNCRLPLSLPDVLAARSVKASRSVVADAEKQLKSKSPVKEPAQSEHSNVGDAPIDATATE